jgi:IclR family acetate operon transcriptional repressor
VSQKGSDPFADAPGRPVGSVARALALLDALAEGPAGVNALARRIDVNPSSASRLLATLEHGGLVERDPGGPYRLGLHLVALADRVLARLDVRDLARPQLRALVEQTGETATLSVPGGDEAVTVDFVPGESSVVSMARLGRPSIGHATAAGKVLLTFHGGEPAALTAYTDRTITDPARLAAELAAVRAQGWAEAEGEREPDLNALAAPVAGRGGELVAILGLQGPAARFTAARRAEVLPRLLEAAAAVGRALGG